MPTINIYYSSDRPGSIAEDILELKQFAAEKLSVTDKKLGADEVSVRLIKSDGPGMLAPIEIEITAAAFKDRVDNQDQICLDFKNYLLQKDAYIKDLQVWLILSELGHSWE